MTDSAQRDLLAGYLFDAPLAMHGSGYQPAAPAPHCRHAVPIEFRTDGVRIWPGAVTYYLRWDGVALDPAFRRHIVANGHRCPPVADDVLRAARRAAHEYLALAHQREIDRQQARRRQTRLCERHAG